MAQSKCTRTGLALYNLISAVGWAFIFYQVVRTYPMVGQPAFFDVTKNIVTFVQCGALIEIINSLFGIVRSPIVTTAAQVLSRLLVVIGIFQLLPETPAAHSISYITLLLAWSTTEVVRYLFYFFTLCRKDGPPKVLLLLRYNLFWVLYPTGVASELSIIYSALPIAERVYGPLYKYVLVGSMLTYIPGLPMLFMHMVAQRRKVMKSLKENPAKKTN
ncbi:hypothetical protein KAFR_0A01400 [Kazachstania africana CBS 2517]|uniref:Very-long-chain (3R)-3-hydroxyacyl-CoA dehydratase n=1 Tax=Kazachstania africana (strain ATCC 22294 / BCRC 22015 / CBS 2517 / CECT 1963 / NBRC 1671 / NRRL Y-8276) TaxID=1071382 RepID=H2AMH8_KAZAF|nr:hypothetical protein KAFR_0A01400 [Kazachstania africana CBS 2517]CCF55578.1 hypothetical protein KAFR_0A01400 [Kazachstania africana CBS 2517]